MSFCSSCGAQNTDDARFCNKCGTQMSVGETAPVPAGAPPTPAPMNTGGTVTLAGIGIQSPSKTYAILGGGAALFLVLGALIAYVGMHAGGTPPSATTAVADATDPGGAIPAGVDVPEDDFVMSGGARVVKRGPSAGGTTPPTSGTTPPGSGTTPPSTTASGHTPTPPATHTTSGSHTGSTGTTTGGATGGTTHGTTPIDPPTSTTGTTGTGGSPPPPSSAVDWDSMSGTVPGDGQDEPDYQMQMYSTQVRRFIRQYLLPQSTSCFEHASATSRDAVRGTVAIGFDIDARGHAQSASIDRNTTGVDSLARCLQNNVNSWQLPPPPAGTAPISMQMPFTR